ncbi:PREDICTED: uncharacterized protein LOC104827334 [Tarenaya hassleriana]|uniref:uncharacterized protein LOC104827334 n=1 Tax=Tarenaya hassleriana TaxID=28532 RepID=UPI00053C44B3|nr:PREDICTED: uncharacterized protein LOC104827334 [Tarenaya hassleriana]
MSSKTPIFPMPESQHFCDYGFDPQIDYFQVLEEARKHKRETSARSSIDALHFKLQKPISKDDPTRSVLHKKKNKHRWWNSAFIFLKWKHRWWKDAAVLGEDDRGVHRARARARALRAAGSVSGPVYVTESRSGSSTPYRSTTSRPSSGPLAGTTTPARKGDVAIPYVSLRELNMEEQQRMPTSSAKPIYLVT